MIVLRVYFGKDEVESGGNVSAFADSPKLERRFSYNPPGVTIPNHLAGTCPAFVKPCATPLGMKTNSTMLSRLPSLSLNQAALTPPKSIIPSVADAPGGGSYSSKIALFERSLETIASTSSTTKPSWSWVPDAAPYRHKNRPPPGGPVVAFTSDRLH